MKVMILYALILVLITASCKWSNQTVIYNKYYVNQPSEIYTDTYSNKVHFVFSSNYSLNYVNYGLDGKNTESVKLFSDLWLIGEPNFAITGANNGNDLFVIAALDDNRRFVVFFTESKDNGKTWSAPVNISDSPVETHKSSLRIKYIKTGRLFAFFNIWPFNTLTMNTRPPQSLIWAQEKQINIGEYVRNNSLMGSHISYKDEKTNTLLFYSVFTTKDFMNELVIGESNNYGLTWTLYKTRNYNTKMGFKPIIIDSGTPGILYGNVYELESEFWVKLSIFKYNLGGKFENLITIRLKADLLHELDFMKTIRIESETYIAYLVNQEYCEKGTLYLIPVNSPTKYKTLQMPVATWHKNMVLDVISNNVLLLSYDDGSVIYAVWNDMKLSVE